MEKITLKALAEQVASLTTVVQALVKAQAPVAKPVAKKAVAKATPTPKAVAPAATPANVSTLEALLEANKSVKLVSTVVKTGEERNTKLSNIKGVMEYQKASEQDIVNAINTVLSGQPFTFKYKSWRLA